MCASLRAMNRNNESGKKEAVIIKGRGNAEAVKFKPNMRFALDTKFVPNKMIKGANMNRNNGWDDMMQVKKSDRKLHSQR